MNNEGRSQGLWRRYNDDKSIAAVDYYDNGKYLAHQIENCDVSDEFKKLWTEQKEWLDLYMAHHLNAIKN